MRNERGQMLFYVVVALPIALTLSVLAIDLTRAQAARDRAQVEGDNIALAAARYLPDRQRALNFIQQSLSARPDLQLRDQSSLVVTSDRVQLTLTSRQESMFDFFLPGRSQDGLVFNPEEASSAQLMPLDLALVVSDSSLLKPPPLGRWGNDAAWPYARYFDFVFLPCRLQNQDASAFGGVLAEVCRDRREEDYFRYATQTCFNPVYSPLKLSVIELLDWLSSVERHRLAVLMTPGDNANRGFQVLRGLSFPTGVRSPVQWSTWSDANMQISDEACLYFSDIEVSPDTPYALSAFDPSILGFTPVTTQNVPDVDSCEKFNPGFPSGSGYHFPLGNVQQCFISNFLSLRDALYHHAARNSSQDLRAGALISALRGAYGELVREDAVGAVRGNLAGRANRIIVAISERLPPANDSQFQELLAQLEAQRISVLFVTYLHPNMANFDGLVAEATARKSALDALNSEQLYVQLAFDAATLRRVLRERVSMFKREVVIRS